MSFIKHISAGSVFLLLAACGMFSQTAAPIEAINTSGSNYGTSTASNNPYGAPPQNDAPYNPSQQNTTAYTPSNNSSSGTYNASNAPVDVNATTHTVVYGDTIYNVAKRYGISQDDLRARNNLTDDIIKVGQVLNLRGSNTSTTNTTVANNKPTTSTPTTSTPATTPVAQSSNTRQVAGITWSRPLQSSTVLSNFGGNSTGVVYGGNAGQPVYAAADGKVVYKGSALPSYGNLLIVQHNKKYLTVYGNNESILVSENQTVKRGQQVAKMGKTDAPRVQLHFEIREDGKPVNPTNYLP